MATVNGQDLLALVENTALIDFGPQLVTLLQGLMAAQGDPLKAAAAWLQFQGNLAPALLKFEADVANQILAALTARVQAAIATAQAAQAALVNQAPALAA